MPCKACMAPTEAIKMITNLEKWLYRDEVKEICLQCYENMISNNISKIKASVLLKSLEDKIMTLYEVIYRGPENSKFNFGGHTLEPNVPMYFKKDELPFSLKQMDGIPHIKYSTVEVNAKPTEPELKAKAARMAGTKGIMWIGKASKRVNDFGTFLRDEPRYDISADDIEKLRNLPGFKVL